MTNPWRTAVGGATAAVMATVVGAGAGCSKGEPKLSQASSAAIATSGRLAVGGDASAASADGGAPASWRTAAIFSSPIAALHGDRWTVVAGLVASTGVVRAVGFRDGAVSWARDVLAARSLDPDAELTIDPAGGDAVAIVWNAEPAASGGSAGPANAAARAAVVGLAGDLRSEPQDVGRDSCTTAEGIAWLESRGHGSAHVFWRPWKGGPSRDVAVTAAGRTPAIACGDHVVFVLGDGGDDLTAAAFVPGELSARPAAVVLSGSNFAEGELERRVYAAGDDLELLRLAQSGALAVRDIPSTGAPGPWWTLKHKLVDDEDIVALDGDSAATVVVSVRSSDGDCPNAAPPAEQVEALRLERSVKTESAAQIAAAHCGRSLGPFWVALTGEHVPLVAWVEQTAEAAARASGGHALVYRLMSSGRVARDGRVDMDADAIANAGCDHSGCFAAALLPAGGRAPRPPSLVRRASGPAAPPARDSARDAAPVQVPAPAPSSADAAREHPLRAPGPILVFEYFSMDAPLRSP